MIAKLVQNDSEIFVNGPNYVEVLRRLHSQLSPRTYFEVGTFEGDTLRLSKCRTVAIDPEFRLKPGVIDEGLVTLWEMTSDDYFAHHDLKEELGEVDVAFLDGMHEFPFLLRDFINTERYCRRESLIVMHDCLPRDYHMTRPHSEIMVQREGGVAGWTGDVWKIVPVLRQYRPDLEIHCLDAEYTGLTICRNLNPENTALKDNYGAILASWRDIALADYGMNRLFTSAQIESANEWLNASNLRPFGKIGWRNSLAPRRRLHALLKAVGVRSVAHG